MGLSSPKSETLFDPIRKKWVEKTPEELVRQLLVRHMIEKLGYPASLIAIEKELSQLPSFALDLTTTDQIPARRADIIVYSKEEDGSLKAVLMIECKAVPLSSKVAAQVIGYNAFVGAPYVAVANQTEVLTGCFDRERGIYQFRPGLPRYEQLTP